MTRQLTMVSNITTSLNITKIINIVTWLKDLTGFTHHDLHLLWFEVIFESSHDSWLGTNLLLGEHFIDIKQTWVRCSQHFIDVFFFIWMSKGRDPALPRILFLKLLWYPWISLQISLSNASLLLFHVLISLVLQTHSFTQLEHRFAVFSSFFSRPVYPNARIREVNRVQTKPRYYSIIFLFFF